MLFVFTRDEAEPTTDFKTGLTITPSYAVEAETYDEALVAFVTYSAANLDGSPNTKDYQDDIDNGYANVFLPTNITRPA